MAIFDNLETTKKVNKISLEQLKSNLSDTQLKVARQNYRVVVTEMALYMDIGSQEVKELIARGIIERLMAYQM